MIETIFKQVRAFCQANADPAIVQKYARFFVEGYDAYGVNKDAMSAEMTRLRKQVVESLNFEEALGLGGRLARTGKYEEGIAAVQAVKAFEKNFSADSFDTLGGWLDEGGFCNWAHVDVFSGDVLGQFLSRGLVGLDGFARWRAVTSKWKRRAVPVSMLAILPPRKALDEQLVFLEVLMEDKEKVVQQGLGWYLREAWKKEPAPVEAFLLKWKDRCGRIIIQYATEKMGKEERVRFRREK
jgi:3-methyladenine DNA glycosylase AlkD